MSGTNPADRTEDERYLESVLASTEHRNLEFKTAANNFSTEKALEYCAGIANAGGGLMVLGVTNERAVVGTTTFADPRVIELRVHEKLGLSVVVRELAYSNHRVLVFQIPARRRGTPVSLDGKFMTRVGESLVAMTAEQLAEVFEESRVRPENALVADRLTADEVERRLDIDAYYRLLGPARPSELSEALARMAGSRMPLVQNADGTYGVTLTAALFIGRDLGDFGLEWRRVRLLKYAGNNRVDAVFEHFESRGYGLMFEDLSSLIQSHLPVREIIEDGRRVVVPHYPPTAVREFLANALVHQDLEEDGVQITVEVFADRLEIRNPGLPLIKVTRFVDDSRARNPDVAEAMRLAGFCEVRGSGVDRALVHIESALQPAPEFRTEDHATSVVLFGERRFDDMTIEERVWATFLHCSVRYVGGEALTNSSLRERFGLSPSKAAVVSQAIAATVERGFIKPDPRAGASKRHARYQPFFA